MEKLRKTTEQILKMVVIQGSPASIFKDTDEVVSTVFVRTLVETALHAQLTAIIEELEHDLSVVMNPQRVLVRSTSAARYDAVAEYISATLATLKQARSELLQQQ